MRTIAELSQAVDDLFELIFLNQSFAGKSFAHSWSDTSVSGFRVSQGGGPGIVASATITPTATGKIRVIVSGAANNASDSGTVAITTSISHGVSVTTPDYTSEATTVPSPASPGGGPIILVVDLFAAAEITFPLNTPVTVNAVLTVLSAGQAVQGAQHAVQIDLSEVP